MCPHTPEKTKLTLNCLVNQPGKHKQNQQYKYSVNQKLLYRLPPYKLQGFNSCKLPLIHLQGWTSYRQQRPIIVHKMTQTNPSPTAQEHVEPHRGLGPRHFQLHPLNWTTNLLLNKHNRKLTQRGLLNRLA